LEKDYRVKGGFCIRDKNLLPIPYRPGDFNEGGWGASTAKGTTASNALRHLRRQMTSFSNPFDVSCKLIKYVQNTILSITFTKFQKNGRIKKRFWFAYRCLQK
jgi:hypothetical protein